MNVKALAAAATVSALLGFAGIHAQERYMGVRQMPDAVFSQPVDAIVPELAGASATGENGRVGGELVFWGYTLADGKPVFMFACAMSDVVNCDERVLLICPDHTNVLRSSMADGNVTRRTCTEAAFVGPGDTRPGCIDSERPAGLTVGLVSCG